MNPHEQKILNARIRLAIRAGELPFTFIDAEEKRYRYIVWREKRRLGVDISANRDGDVWTIDFKAK